MTPVITAERFNNWLWRLDMGRLATGVTVVLVLLLAFSLARLTWGVIAPDPVVAMAPAADRASAPRAGDGLAPAGPDVASVARLHLFGHAVPGEQPHTGQIDAPETRLRLHLRGVVAAEPSGQGVALIAGESNDERHYQPGAEIPGGATLEQVHADRVILRRDGRLEMLRLPRDAPPSGDVPATSTGSTGESGIMPAAARRQWLEDPTALFEAIQIQPVMQDGALHGFAISPRRDPRLFRAVGLRPGDVVTAINGISVIGMDDPTALRDQLAGVGEIRLDIERNGRPDTVLVPVGP